MNAKHSDLKDFDCGILHARLNDVEDFFGENYWIKENGFYDEIILTNNSPQRLKDRRVLWDAINQSEPNIDNNNVRHIDILFPMSLGVLRIIDLVREFAIIYFVNQGMITDILLWKDSKNNGYGILTVPTRGVTSEGFGPRNKNWGTVKNKSEWKNGWRELAIKYLNTQPITPSSISNLN